MFSWFKKEKQGILITPIITDIHSHLLPSLDDGVKTVEESGKILQNFLNLGYKKVITTPHIMSDSYRNTPAGIFDKLIELKAYLAHSKIDIAIEAAAEYYLDEYLVESLKANNQLLTFGDKYLLFETNFLTEPLNLKEFIFIATTKGYKPVLAHPERYLYLQNNVEKLQDLLDRGVLFQVNISSLTGYYSKPVQQAAQKLIDLGWIHFLGSDCHHEQHVKLTEQAQRLRYYKKALALPLLNNSL